MVAALAAKLSKLSRVTRIASRENLTMRRFVASREILLRKWVVQFLYKAVDIA